MNDQIFREQYEIEERHGWYRGQRIVLNKLLHTYSPEPHLNILNIGCGSGRTLEFLSQFGAVAGVDERSASVEYCQNRGFTQVQNSLYTHLPFGDDSFDVITVLGTFDSYSFSEKFKILEELNRVLMSGGMIYLTTFGSNPEELFEELGFDVLRSSKLQFLLSLTALMVPNLKDQLSLFGKVSQQPTRKSKLFSWLVEKTMALESNLIPYLSLPYGSGRVIVAQKSSVATNKLRLRPLISLPHAPTIHIGLVQFQ